LKISKVKEKATPHNRSAHSVRCNSQFSDRVGFELCTWICVLDSELQYLIFTY